MTRKTGIREVVLEVLQDKEWHTTEEITEKCTERGINLDNGKASLYTTIYRLKKQGIVDPEGNRKYKLLDKATDNIKDMDADLIIKGKENNKKAMDSIRVLERQLEELKRFNWISCPDSELTEARKLAKRMLNLSEKIQSAFSDKKI